MAGRWKHKNLRNTPIHIGSDCVQCDAHGHISGVTADAASLMKQLPAEFFFTEDAAPPEEKAAAPPEEKAPAKKAFKKKAGPKK